MTQTVGETVDVVCVSKTRPTLIMPQKIKWRNRVYVISQIGLHHQIRRGQTLFHIFSVSTGTLFLRLSLNTENLLWTLEEISDGIAS